MEDGRSRPLSFTGHKDELGIQTRAVFKDFITEDNTVVLQMKNENWGGAFIDLGEDIPDRSMLKALIVPTMVEKKTCSRSGIEPVKLELSTFT